MSERKTNAIFIVLGGTNVSEVMKLGRGHKLNAEKGTEIIMSIVDDALQEGVTIPKENLDETKEQLVEVLQEFLKSEDDVHRIDLNLLDSEEQVHAGQILIQKTYLKD